MTTVFASAPMMRAISLPIVTGMSHQPSAHARTPRVAQMSAYSCRSIESRPRHRAETVRDQIDRSFENRKFRTPFEKVVSHQFLR